MNLGKLWFTVGADTSGLPGDLAGAQAQVQQSLQAMSAAAAATYGYIYSAGSRFLSGGMNAAAEFEKTTVEMETMIGSAESTKKTLDDLTKYAVDTPFTMPTLLNVTKQLVTFGERGEQLMGTIRMLGDASGGDAMKFGLLGSVFNQIRGTGKLLTQDFRQLSTRGIISLQDIAKHYKVTTQAADKMLSNGKVSFNDFRKILMSTTADGGRFEGIMLKTSRTLGGLKSTFSDAVGIAQRMIGTALVPYMKAVYIAGIEVANMFAALATNGGEVLAFSMVSVTAFSSVAAAIYGMAFAARFLGVQGKTTGAILFQLWGKALRVMPWLAAAAAVGALIGWIARLQPVQEAFAAAWKRASEYIDVMRGFWVQFFASIQPQIDRISAAWGVFSDNMGRVFGDAITTITGYFTTGTLDWTNAMMAFMWYVMDTVEWLVDGMAYYTQDIGLTWELMYNNIMYYTLVCVDKIVMVFNTVVATVVAVAYSIGIAFTTSLENIGKAVWWLGETFVAWGAYGISVMQDIAYNTVIAFKLAFQEIGNIFAATWKAIKSKAMGGNFTAIFKYELDRLRKEQAGDESNAMRKVGASGKAAYDERMKNRSKPDMKDPVAAAAEAFTTTFNNWAGKDSPFEADLKLLGDKSKDIRARMDVNAEFDKVMRELDRGNKAYQDKKNKKPKEMAAEAAAAAANSSFMLPAGKYGFAELGNKIQDQLLGKNGDTGQQQVDLLSAGNDLQKQQLDATKAITTGLK